MDEDAGPVRSIKRRKRARGISRRVVAIAIMAIVGVAGIATAMVIFQPSRQDIIIDGSSTVFPITTAWAEVMNRRDPAVTYNVAFSGTGAGFSKFCDGRIHLSDASRPIKQIEIEACRANGVEPVAFQAGFDGVSVVVHGSNTFATALTTGELCRIWTSNTSAGACDGAGPRVTHWNEINPAWPTDEIVLFGPGTDSGTFDYFREEILKARGDEITDQFTPSENDNFLVEGVANNPTSLGYFGYAFAKNNLDRLNIVALDDGMGPVTPTPETIESGEYAPLSRPVFVYADAKGSLRLEAVKEFLRFGFSGEGQSLVGSVGYVGLSPALIQEQLDKIPP